MTTNGNNCCVYGCGNTSKYNKDISFFSVPSDRKKLAEWLPLIRREDLLKKSRLSQRICSDHFSEELYTTNIIRKLKKNAIPNMKLPDSLQEELVRKKKRTEAGPSKWKNNSLEESQEHQTRSVSTQTQIIYGVKDNSTQTMLSEVNFDIPIITSLNNTPRKRKLRMELAIAKKKLKALEQKEVRSAKPS